MQLRHKLKQMRGTVGWNYVVALILVLVVIVIILLLMGKTRTFFLEKIGFLRLIFGG